MDSPVVGLFNIVIGCVLLANGLGRLRTPDGGELRDIDGGPNHIRWDLLAIGLLCGGVGSLIGRLPGMVATWLAGALVVIGGVCSFWFMGSVLYNRARRARRQHERVG